MNFLPGLIGLGLCASLLAQNIDPKPRGGGLLKIGALSYRFDPLNLTSAPPKGGLPGAVKLEGDLIPANGGSKFHLLLIVLKNGSLYMLQIRRAAPGGFPDSWAATMKTRIHVVDMADHPGGRIVIRCEGPLTGVIAQRPEAADWSGTLWAVFPGGGEVLQL